MFNPEQNLGSITSSNYFNWSNLPSTKISLFYFSTYKWNFNFKFCNVTYNMMPYARKMHYEFLMINFHVELYRYDQFCVKLS
jgi:hypothetical protein